MGSITGLQNSFYLKKIKSWAEEESWGGWVDVVKNTFKGGIPSGV